MIIMHTTVLARIIPLFNVVDVAPTAGPFVGEITEIPLEAKSVNGHMEIAHAIDETTPHVPAATATTQKH